MFELGFYSRYHEHIVWDDKDIKLKLLRKGILTRIYAPMVSMFINILHHKKFNSKETQKNLTSGHNFFFFIADISSAEDTFEVD